MSYPEASQAAPAGAPAIRWPELPGAVLASVGVAPDVLALAAGLCGVEPGWLASLPEGLPATALVLVNPEVAELSDVAPALAQLANQGVHVGMLYTLDPVESRLAILKSLLLDRYEGNGTYTVLFADPDPSADDGPASLKYASSPEGRRRFSLPQDLVLLNGHANPLDAAMGAQFGLCARAGTDAPLGTGQAFPCFEDGRCFRQPLMGRQPEDHTGLLSVREAYAAFLVLSGCGVATLGKSWFDPRHGLAYQCQQHGGLASAVTCGVTLESLELDLLFVALAAEGLPLGEVVDEVNRVRATVHLQAGTYAPGLGPFILLGNPCLRLSGFRMQEATAVPGPGGVLRVDLNTVRLDADGSALLRVPLPTGPPPLIFLHAAPEGAWCRGVWYPGRDGTFLYLWLRAESEDGHPKGALELEVCSDDPTAAVVAATENSLQQVPYWMVALNTFRSRWGQVTPPPDSLDAVLAALPGMVSDLSLAATALRPAPGVLGNTGSARAIAGLLWRTLGDIDSALLRCLVDSACRFGTLPLAGWEVNFRRVESLDGVGRCACGGPVTGQLYRYPDGGPLRRANYQCPRCGPIGEDDGRRLLHVTELPATVAQGNELTVSAACSAPDDEVVQVHAVAFLESVFRDRRMVGHIVAETVNPGEHRELTLQVHVPKDLVPGVYPFAVLAVVNGAGYLIRQLIEVVRPAGQG
jgi:hypothetical protein